jgi:hypothetical protein
MQSRKAGTRRRRTATSGESPVPSLKARQKWKRDRPASKARGVCSQQARGNAICQLLPEQGVQGLAAVQDIRRAKEQPRCSRDVPFA